MNRSRFFEDGFGCLTGNSPFAWQRRLFVRLVEADIAPTVDIPTGLGKTAVIPIWLLAFVWQLRQSAPRLPRRLVYVVDRRTVVDQATDVVTRIRAALRAETEPARLLREVLAAICLNPRDEASPLAISTLRGELADNRHWQTDPGRAAVIIGTVDMIGSRLLFSGYGVSPRMRPFHAGLLGQDVLIVHDEAHLTRPFSSLIRRVAAIQNERLEPRPMRLMELSATHATGGAPEGRFTLSEQETSEAEVSRRLRARKLLRLGRLSPGTELPEALSTLALDHEDEAARVVIYVRLPKIAKEVARHLEGGPAEGRVSLLTGTIRGYERDALAADPLFASFRSDPDRQRPERTVYLVATSAGEVGLDIDADHMVSDLTTLDSMIQRLGRVNRLGRGKAVVDVLEPDDKADDDSEGDAGARLRATRKALESLPALEAGRDASPLSLQAIGDRHEAFSRTPRTPELTDVLLDAWALTRVKDLPGRPPVARWLHGVEAGAPQMHVAWREEVAEIGEVDRQTVATLLDMHPLESRELLRGNVDDVIDELKKILKRRGTAGTPAILLPIYGDPVAGNLSDLLNNERLLLEATIVLPPEAGGLDRRGMLDGSRAEIVHDVADMPSPSAPQPKTRDRNRRRVLLVRDSGTEQWSTQVLGSTRESDEDGDQYDGASLPQAVAAVRRRFPGMIDKGVLIIRRDEDGEPSRALLLLVQAASVDAAQDSPSASFRAQELDEHLEWAREEANRIVERLGLQSHTPTMAAAVIEAARRHDRGKDRSGWQKAIGHPPPRGQQGDAAEWKPWAKSNRKGFDDAVCGRYRHEFGSLRDAHADQSLQQHPERDLVLHLIAAHHGWARPHFDAEQWDIADDVTEQENSTIAAEAMRRFARLQRRFGHWGLAWLEALVRSADYTATRRLSNNDEATERSPE